MGYSRAGPYMYAPHMVHICIMYPIHTYMYGKYIAIQASRKKIEKSRTQQLSLHLKGLENQQQIKPTPHIRREILKIRDEINGVETRDIVERIN